MTIRIISFLACCTLVLSAASVPIGVLTTVDSVRMDNQDVRGTGTVLNGSVIETLRNPTQLSLKNGTRFDLYPNSRATVYNDRFVLERGSSQIHAAGSSPASSYSVVANTLQIVPSGPSSTIRVSRNSASALEVSAVSGQAEVRNDKGLLLARVFPGSALDFDQQPGGAAGPSSVNGKVSKTSDGHYLLTDSATSTTVEIQGDNLDSTVGHCIAATGSADPTAAPASGATQLIHVAAYKRVTCGKKGAAGAAAGGAAAGAGLSHAAIAGIVIAVAAGGTVGGLAAAGAFSSSTTASKP